MKASDLVCPKCGASYVPTCKCHDGPAPDFLGDKNPRIGTCSVPEPLVRNSKVVIMVRPWAGKPPWYWATIVPLRHGPLLPDSPPTQFCFDLPAQGTPKASLAMAKAFCKTNGLKIAVMQIEKGRRHDL